MTGIADAVPNMVTLKLFTLLEFVLEGCKFGDVSESGLLDSGIDLLDSLLGGISLGILLCGLSLGV